jgi:HSP20 family protein
MAPRPAGTPTGVRLEVEGMRAGGILMQVKGSGGGRLGRRLPPDRSLMQINMDARAWRKIPRDIGRAVHRCRRRRCNPPQPGEAPMALPTRYNPLRQVSLLDPFVDLEDLFRGNGTRSSRGYEKALEMHMDVHEDDKAYHITVDVPGVKKEDIDVSVEGNMVTITAEVKREQSREKEKEVHSERFHGKAFRSFTLPTEVDSGKSQARYDGGVLSLTLSKKGDSGSRHLSIN